LTFVGASLTVQHKDLGNIPGGRLQIGIMAGLKSEYMADIASEQLADFVGIRTHGHLCLLGHPR
jgi:hypothetical protein